MTARRRAWLIGLRVAVSVAGLLLVLSLLAAEDWTQVRRLVGGMGVGAVLLALVATLASRLAVAARWHALLRGIDLKVRARETFEITFAGLFAANFLPTTVGGDLVRLAGAFQLDIDRAVATASLIVDRLVGMAGMALLVPVGLAQAIPLMGSHAWIVPAGAPLAATAAAGTEPGPIQRAIRAVRGPVRRVWEAFGLWRTHRGALASALLWTALHMTLLFATIALILQAMGYPRSLLAIGGAWSLVYFITLFPFSLNGLGVQEVALTYVFTTLLGIPAGPILVLAVLLRLLQMMASLPGALFLGTLLPQARAVAAETEHE